MEKKQVLQQLSIEEKIKWTAGNNMWTMIGNKKAGIRPLVVADGPHGVRVYKEGPQNQALEEKDLIKTTLFPSATAMASTFNEELIYTVGEAIGKECNMHSVDVLLAPGINLKRSPLGGRNFEYYSEDPFLTGTIATNFVSGVQSTGVGACIKHFVTNEQENQRRFVNTIIDKRTLHELYLKPFEMVIKDAKPHTLMTSYNRINGDYASESTYLLQDVLRTKWNFDGVIMSDWHAVQNKVKSIKNGLTVEMPGPSEFTNEVVEALEMNQLNEATLDRCLMPLLDLYDKAEQNPNKGLQADKNAHHQLASRVAEEAIVLLKNDGVLPLETSLHLGVIGTFAQTPRINGGGSASLKPFVKENPLQELSQRYKVSYAPGYQEENTSEDLVSEALSVAEESDVIVYFTGTTTALETEGRDREHNKLPQGHRTLFDALSSVGKPVVMVLQNGSSIDITDEQQRASAVVESYFLGGANGTALANILDGSVNPSGRLSETFPLRIEHTPLYPEFPIKEDNVYYYGDITRVGYRYYDTHKYDVLYPFGYGLSYTTFAFSNITLSKSIIDEDDLLHVSIDVTNTGNVAGKEVVQLYVRDQLSYLPRPNKELKGFKKVHLAPRETKTVSFALNHTAFSVYVEEIDAFAIEPGLFDILIGHNVRDITQQATVDVQPKKAYPYPLTLEHTLKKFFEYRPQKAQIIIEKYRKIPIFEIEEPAGRVLKRLKLEFNIPDDEYEALLLHLLTD